MVHVYFLVLCSCMCTGHWPPLSLSFLYISVCNMGKLCAVNISNVLEHAELGNGEWKVQRCKCFTLHDSLER